MDSETGLYNYGARLYDPVVGKFISADTVVPNFADPQSLNRYAYCRNNPLRYVDPTGHFSLDDFFESIFSDFVGGAVFVLSEGNPVLAGMAAGAVSGAGKGDIRFVVMGAVTGGIAGGIGGAGYSSLISAGFSASAATGTLIAAGAGIAGATGGWDGLASYASGFAGSVVGYYGTDYAMGLANGVGGPQSSLCAGKKAITPSYIDDNINGVDVSYDSNSRPNPFSDQFEVIFDSSPRMT